VPQTVPWRAANQDEKHDAVLFSRITDVERGNAAAGIIEGRMSETWDHIEVCGEEKVAAAQRPRLGRLQFSRLASMYRRLLGAQDLGLEALEESMQSHRPSAWPRAHNMGD
jgi:hypothetical protein